MSPGQLRRQLTEAIPEGCDTCIVAIDIVQDLGRQVMLGEIDTATAQNTVASIAGHCVGSFIQGSGWGQTKEACRYRPTPVLLPAKRA